MGWVPGRRVMVDARSGQCDARGLGYRGAVFRQKRSRGSEVERGHRGGCSQAISGLLHALRLVRARRNELGVCYRGMTSRDQQQPGELASVTTLAEIGVEDRTAWRRGSSGRVCVYLGGRTHAPRQCLGALEAGHTSRALRQEGTIG